MVASITSTDMAAPSDATGRPPLAAQAYPTRAAHAHAWQELAREIAAAEGSISETPTAPTGTPGELVIMGSGIETVGFALGDEELLRTADNVFFCVADPATVVWIKTIRPDAFDLYVLYDDSKVRYTTYMQMAEAMLHPVRQGKRVVCIFYGHPGIFVLATHRAVLVARREGHQATMRSNVSALDCLCADLGVDPCHPGMQTHEATDMLIRGRLPDTNLHVVLWQVGLIGEMGFRRKGYLNSNFSVLIEYLQNHYGDDYPMTHYVASRYPTIPPLIETYPLSAYHDPARASRVTGISTVYLAPRDDAPADRGMLERLGMIRPGQEVKSSNGPLREIGKYGQRERKAFRAFRDFSIPGGYHWQGDTAGSRFLIALRRDPRLQRLYATAPEQAVDEACPGISANDRRLLVRRDPGAIQIAAKGTRDTHEANQTFYKELLRSRKLQQSLLRLVQSARGGNLVHALRGWAPALDYPVDWERLRLDMESFQRNQLFPWAGIYVTQGAGPQHMLVLSVARKRTRLWLDGKPVPRFSFRHGVLEWKAGAGEHPHGFLRIDHDRGGRRRLLGSIWPEGQAVPADYNTELAELSSPRGQPSGVVGCYRNAERPGDRLEIVVGPVSDGEHDRFTVQARLNGQPVAGPIKLDRSVLTVGSQEFPLQLGPQSATDPVGWRPEAILASAYFGTFRIRTAHLAWVCELSAEGVRIDGVVPEGVRFTRDSVTWSGGPPSAPRGSVRLLLNPFTLHPALFGTADTAPLSGATCFAPVPVPSDVRVDATPLGLAAPLGDSLTHTAVLSGQSGVLLWQMAEKANLGSLLAVRVLARQLP